MGGIGIKKNHFSNCNLSDKQNNDFENDNMKNICERRSIHSIRIFKVIRIIRVKNNYIKNNKNYEFVINFR